MNTKILIVALTTVHREIVDVLVALKDEAHIERAKSMAESASNHLEKIMNGLEDQP